MDDGFNKFDLISGVVIFWSSMGVYSELFSSCSGGGSGWCPLLFVVSCVLAVVQERSADTHVRTRLDDSGRLFSFFSECLELGRQFVAGVVLDWMGGWMALPLSFASLPLSCQSPPPVGRIAIYLSTNRSFRS